MQTNKKSHPNPCVSICLSGISHTFREKLPMQNSFFVNPVHFSVQLIGNCLTPRAAALHSEMLYFRQHFTVSARLKESSKNACFKMADTEAALE